MIDCKECEAIRVSIPTDVPPEISQWLSLHNLDITRTIRAWPAGLPGRNWDSEGAVNGCLLNNRVWRHAGPPCRFPSGQPE